MEFAVREFALREEKCVRVAWVGHDGRSGSVVTRPATGCESRVGRGEHY